MKHFTDHAMDKAIALLKKGTSEQEGRILAYWTSGGTCYAMVQLYDKNSFNGKFTSAIGKAGGYGYDKFSAAISDALCKAGIAGTHDEISPFTFGVQKKETAEKILAEKRIIPVYGGAGNVREAFSIFFDYIEVL